MRKEEIVEAVSNVANRKFGPNFNFRPGQREAIIDILDTYYNTEVETYILEAPTGSGKSLIAMIASAVLEENGRKGYILTSELALQDQYHSDFKKYSLKWGCIKGADTYLCAVNLMPFSLGDCRIQKISYDQAEELPCFSECGYLQNRKKSIQAPVSLLNYSYALIQRNYVEDQVLKRGGDPPFPQRDFVFCDEAHGLMDIVQGHFAPRINQDLIDAVKYLDGFQRKNGYGNTQIEPQISSLVFLLEHEVDKSILKNQLKMIYTHLSAQKGKDRMMQEDAPKKFDNWSAIPQDWRRALKYADFIKDVHCKVEDFLKIIEGVGVDKMVKTVNVSARDTNEIIFNCVDEGYMVDKYFNQKFGFKVLMSATIGDPRYFMSAIGTRNVRFNRIKSHFNFEKSPIYFTPRNRITYKNLDERVPVLGEYVTNILRKHSDTSGIIHSGSYSLAKRVWQELPIDLQRRVKLYEGTNEKINAVGQLEIGNTVIMGPSLLEGLDLSEDTSRLQIFLKVPYPSLGNNFVKEKMNHYPAWYRWRASIAVQQGVGRSVRSADDWAITYFLDGCLQDILREEHSFPPDFKNRIINIDKI
jgi:Rad3-related DNA helicase